MPWPWQSGPGSSASGNNDGKEEKRSSWTSSPWTTEPSTKKPVSWNDSMSVDPYKDPRIWVRALILTTALFGGIKFYRVYLRRIPSIEYIHPDKYRRRTLFGRVTSVGDGDGFHLFHTPGGRWAGWGWLRKIPTDKKALKGNTIPIRIAGIDAPEGAHFGRPSQPGSAEALQWLHARLLHRAVRARIYKRDQYERVVATVYAPRLGGLVPGAGADVGLEMVRRGLATAYDAKSGAEFGGPVMEARYRAEEAEARRKGLGLWGGEKKSAASKKGAASHGSGGGGDGGGGAWGRFWAWFGLGGGKTDAPDTPFETPRQYKDRMRELEKAAEKTAKGATKKV